MSSPKIFGRYEPLGVIGATGGSRVMRVRDLLEGDTRALKVLLDAANTERFFREFEILASINHPQIVRVFDFGLDPSGLRYFTMEYLPGRPLSRVVSERLSIPRITDIARQILTALAVIHARGILHADLKPQNIFLVDEGDGADRIKLLDFGLASLSRDRDFGAARGTLPYIAPEWLQRSNVDQRSDLYSAGVVLFELLTGRQPFPALDLDQHVKAKLSSPAPSVLEVRPDCTQELANLVSWLLERDPALRPQSAAEALKALEEDGLGGSSSSSSAFMLSGLPLIGRDGLLTNVSQGLQAVVGSSSGRMLLLSADVGGGKGRILQEIKGIIQKAGHKVMEARGGDVHGQPPLRQLLMAPVKLRAEANRPLIQRYQTTLNQLFGVGESAPARAELSAAELLGFLDGLVSFLLELSAREPLVLLLDDLHRADPATQDLFLQLGWRIHQAPILICATVDPSWLEGRDDYQELLEHASAEVMRLEPLSLDEIHVLLRELFGAMAGADRLATQMLETTAGNPALLSEALESLVDGGALFNERGRWYVNDEGATDVLSPARGMDRSTGLLRRRLEPLTPIERELLEAAAVVGIELDEVVLKGLVGGGQWVTETLERLVKRSLLIPVADQAGRLRFQQPRMQPYLIQALSSEARRALHRRAGEFVLASIGGAVANPEKLPDRTVDELARHFLAAGDLEAGRTFGVLAALRAEQQQALRQALERYEQLLTLAWSYGLTTPPDVREKIADIQLKLGHTDEALEEYRDLLDESTPWERSWLPAVPGQLPARARLFNKLGTVYGAQGNFTEALVALTESLPLIPEYDVRARVQSAGIRSTYLLMKGDLDQAEATAKEGLQLVGEHPVPSLVAPAMRLWIALADVATFRNNLADAEVCVARGLALAGKIPPNVQPQDEREIQRHIGDLNFIRGIALQGRGKFPESVEASLEALSHYEALRDLNYMAKCYNNIGAAWCHMGDWAQAIDYWERFKDIAERARAKGELANACNNLGWMYKETGQLEKANSTLEQALKLGRRLDMQVMMPTLLGNLGEVKARQGNVEEARRLYDQAVGVAKDLDIPAERAENLRRLAELSLDEGRSARLRREVSEGLEVARAGGLRIEEANLLVIMGAEAANRNQTEKALAHFRQAEDLLKEHKAELERARLKYRLGEAFNKLGFPSEAESALRVAEETFLRLGAAWDLRRTREALRGLVGEVGGGGLAFRKLQLLLEVTRTLGTELELEPLLKRVLEKSIELTQTERGFVILLDEKGNPTFHATRQIAREDVEAGQMARLSNTVLQKVLSSGKALAVTNVDQQLELRAQESIIALGLRSIMCAPMKRGEHLLGLIYVDSSKVTEGFYQADVTLLQALADAAAISIENAQLIGSLRRKNDLMSILAHEFRSPITASISFTRQLLRDAHTLSGDQRDSLKAIMDQGDRLNRMIGNILELARMEADKIEWQMDQVSLQKVLKISARGIEPVARERRIGLVVRPFEEQDLIFGNEDRLIQVCTNLLSNALKFTPERGRVEVSCDIVEFPKPLRRSATDPNAGTDAWVTRTLPTGHRLSDTSFVAVRFQDSGPGIPPEDLERIFQRFAQSGDSQSRARGTGLGLTIAREIVVQHGGRLWAENSPGGGAVFVFCLPRVLTT